MEKDIAASKEYFNKKVKYVTEQMEKVQVMLFNSDLALRLFLDRLFPDRQFPDRLFPKIGLIPTLFLP